MSLFCVYIFIFWMIFGFVSQNFWVGSDKLASKSIFIALIMDFAIDFYD